MMTSLFQLSYHSPLGSMLLLAQPDALVGVYFKEQKYYLRGFEGLAIAEQETDILRATATWLDRYFAHQKPSVNELPLNPQGTAFQHRVWSALAEIPYGEVVTYGELASRLGCHSAQAIGGAVGKNPLSIIIPCHRVLGAGGKLVGYAGGIDRKLALLELEKAHDFL